MSNQNSYNKKYFIFKEIMLIAHSFEGELCQEKAKIKELEEYLDVLLLKVNIFKFVQ